MSATAHFVLAARSICAIASSGSWAERLDGTTPRGTLVIEPSRSADDIGMLLQFGLTREAEVARAMIRGLCRTTCYV